MTAFPSVIDNAIGSGITGPGVFGHEDDPAKYVIERRRFERPSISVPGGPSFEWPLGVEGIVISGSATLAEHKYIGDNAVVLQVMHRDDRRIILSGMFAGVTGSENVRDLLEVVEADTPAAGKVLTLPAIILPKNQLVMVENYNFEHMQDDRNDSWTYTITLRRTGVRGLVKKPKVINTPVNPNSKKPKNKGKSGRVFTVRNGARTLRAVAKIVYKNDLRWREIYNKNQKALNKLDTPLHELPIKTLPLGMKLEY